MDAQSYNYWVRQGSCPPPHQTTVFELPSSISSIPKIPTVTDSPVSATYDNFSTSIQPAYYAQQTFDAPIIPYPTYSFPVTPPDLVSDHDSPYGSPRALAQPEPVSAFPPIASSSAEKPHHATSGRRRAQNRAAQRAFRERKEKHARDLETQLAALTEKYGKLEASHTELSISYEKLRKMLEILTQDDGDGTASKQKRNAYDTLKKILGVSLPDVKGVVKMEGIE
ncbi:hypothetical protein M011DRAFT_425620 [Sporormia fimetaria CBS 119925]|uniref:BZIP domain-containing protein n=1 Tax=Sporormia fimetaria CBS 119925 TaxID=1340428 RepID=A0A6A6V9U8_9PLEO|nr:hypothetical protein M011DRAFT_425620 [Sporormia fimetaria CBS 119925]